MIVEYSSEEISSMSVPSLNKQYRETSSAAVPFSGRILLIAPQPFFLTRGTPINVRAMATILAEAGYAVDLLVYPMGEEVVLPGVSVIRTLRVPFVRSVPIGPSWKKLIFDPLLFLHGLYLLTSRRYSVIHGIEEGGCIAWVLSALFRVPFVYDMDSCMAEQLESAGVLRFAFLKRLFVSLEKHVIGRASAVLTVCRALSRKVELFGFGARVHQIEDFPYPPSLVSNAEGVRALEEEFGQLAPTVLYTGNIESYQGIDLLLEAFAEFYLRSVERDKSFTARLMIVGGGEVSDPALRSYARRAEELGISNQVVFTGSRPATEMGNFQQFADVLVSPRIEGENTPLKLYSYMAAGKPIVATHILSHTQVLSEQSAYLAAPNVSAFASAIGRACDVTPIGLERSSKKAECAKNLVTKRYSEDEFRSRLLKMYAGLLAPTS